MTTIGKITGVGEKDHIALIRTDGVKCRTVKDWEKKGFNTCLQTEVVVDERKLRRIFLEWDNNRQAEKSWTESVCELGASIATAIEKGEIVKPKTTHKA